MRRTFKFGVVKHAPEFHPFPLFPNRICINDTTKKDEARILRKVKASIRAQQGQRTALDAQHESTHPDLTTSLKGLPLNQSYQHHASSTHSRRRRFKFGVVTPAPRFHPFPLFPNRICINDTTKTEEARTLGRVTASLRAQHGSRTTIGAQHAHRDLTAAADFLNRMHSRTSLIRSRLSSYDVYDRTAVNSFDTRRCLLELSLIKPQHELHCTFYSLFDNLLFI